MRDVSPCIL